MAENTDYQAVYPGRATFPGASTFPSVPGEYHQTPRFTGSNGTTVPVFIVHEISEQTDTNTIIHPTPNGPALVDVRPWSPALLSIGCIVPDYATYQHLKALYESGAVVTMYDPGSPWNGLRHRAYGSLSYRSIALEGTSALLEARIEAVAQ